LPRRALGEVDVVAAIYGLQATRPYRLLVRPAMPDRGVSDDELMGWEQSSLGSGYVRNDDDFFKGDEG